MMELRERVGTDTNFCLKCMQELVAGRCLSCTDTAMEQDSRHLKPGTILKEKYLIGYSIGAGGFGITYIGRDLVLGMRIAVKEYYPSQFSVRNSTISSDVTAAAVGTASSGNWNSYERSKERFLNEVRTLARFEKDTGIVDVKDFFEANNTAYIVMEYIDGLTLKEFIEVHGNFDAEDIIEKMQPVMKSLAHVHKQGLLHRDISPDNIKIPTEGNLKLLDFGAARFVSEDTYRTVTNMTKPGYAPEEQYRSGGDLGPWSDIYALCATIYKCVTGITPSDAPQRLHNKTRHRRDIATPSELGISIRPELEYAILKGMSVLQEERYQNISELQAALAGGVSPQTPNQTPLSDSSLESTQPPFAVPQNSGELSSLTIAAAGSSSALSQRSQELSEATVAAAESSFAWHLNSRELSELTIAADEPPLPLSQSSQELFEETVGATESPFAWDLNSKESELTVASDLSYALPQKPFEPSEPTPKMPLAGPLLSPKSFNAPQTSQSLVQPMSSDPFHSSPQPSLHSLQPPHNLPQQTPMNSPQTPMVPPPSPMSSPQPQGSIPLFDNLASKRKDKSNQSHHSSSQPPMNSPQSNNSLPLFDGSASRRRYKSAKIIVISCAAGLVLIIAAILIIMGLILSNPDAVAKDYYKALVNEDYAKAFTYISIDSSEFINEKSYTKYMQEKKEQISFVENFTVKSEDNASTRDVSILDSNSEVITSFVLKKNNKKKFAFFDDYSISIDDALVFDYKISVPAGFSAKLNGIDLKDPDVSKEGVDTYTIARIFPGKDYELHVTNHPIFEDYINNAFEIKTDDKAESLAGRTPRQSVCDVLKNKAEEDYKKIFLGALERKGFEQMSVACTSNETKKDDIKDKISAFSSKIMPASGEAYKSVNFKSFSDTSKAIVNDNMTYLCTLSVVYDCVKVSTIKNPNPYLVDTIIEKKHPDQHQTIKFCYAYENDTWVLYEIESLGASY